MRFSLERNCCLEPEGPLRKTEKEEQWWGQSDFKLFRHYSKKEAASQDAAFLKDFGMVYDACVKGEVKKCIRECLKVSSSPARGLESIVYPALMRDRKLTIQGFLRAQTKLPENMDGDKREQVLASTSRYLTRQARQLAKVLGSGDAAVARKVNK